eukprot:jgi/Mesvir1/8195/Mv12490-RA.1
METYLVIAITAVLAVILAAVLGIFPRKAASSHKAEGSQSATVNTKEKQAPAKRGKEKVVPKRNEECLATLKGNTENVLSMAVTPDGKYLATACGTSTINVFKVDDVHAKSFKIIRVHLDAFNATCVSLGAGGLSEIVVASTTPTGAAIAAYAAPAEKGAGAAGGSQLVWSHQDCHGTDGVLNMQGGSHPISHASVVATCSSGTHIKVWAASNGQLLGEVDTSQLQNHMVALSPNGRFMAAAAFTADVKIWEVVADKLGRFTRVDKVMQLKGHKKGLVCLAFNNDGTRVVTVSRDGTWKLWNINVRYDVNEDPKCILTAPCAPTPDYDLVALAPGDNPLLAAVKGRQVFLLDTTTGTLAKEVHDAHDAAITSLLWFPSPLPTDDGPAAVFATGSADKKVKLWRA